MSSGEQKIFALLRENKISFQREFTFADCRHKLPLPFDFLLKGAFGYPKILVEFDGEQHFYQVWNKQKGLNVVRRNDTIKNKYCLRNKIPLIRIPYWEKENINLSMLNPKTSKFLVSSLSHNSIYYITHPEYTQKGGAKK